MKLYLSILAILILASCNRKTSCRHDGISYVYITDWDSTLDSSVKIVGYIQGSHFATPVDSTEVAVTSARFLLSTTGEKDWTFTIYPRNETHVLRDIKYGSETAVQSSGFTKRPCTSSLTCYVDDSLISFPAEFELDYPVSHNISIRH